LVTSPLSVIVCATRDAPRLARSLDALAAGTDGIAYELVLVLSGADDDVVRLARERAADAIVVRSDVNLGFAGAANLGRSRARSELLLLLHDDAVVEAGTVERLVAAMARHPDAGIVGPLVLDDAGRIRHAGPVLFADAYSSSPAIGEDPGAAAFAPRPTDYCGTCCALVRASTWDACGGLNESLYPSGYVDVDLAFSARRLGWSVRFEPTAVIRHGEGSLAQGYKGWAFSRNRERFIARWREDLAAHVPSGDGGAEAIDRAVDLAAGRMPAEPPRALPPREAPSAATAPERDAALLRGYAASLEAELATRREEVVGLHASLAAAHTRLADLDMRVRDEIGTRDDHVALLAEQLRSLNAAAATDAVEIRRLQAVEATLRAVTAGRWWRLRGRLLRLRPRTPRR
jgi:GT2 family glycosyltransferase